MLKRLWEDEGGAIISAELVLVLTITVIGMTVGLVCVRDAVVFQLGNIAQGLASIDASFEFGGVAMTGAAGAAGVTDVDAATGGASFDGTAGTGDITATSGQFGVTFIPADGGPATLGKSPVTVASAGLNGL